MLLYFLSSCIKFILPCWWKAEKWGSLSAFFSETWETWSFKRSSTSIVKAKKAFNHLWSMTYLGSWLANYKNINKIPFENDINRIKISLSFYYSFEPIYLKLCMKERLLIFLKLFEIGRKRVDFTKSTNFLLFKEVLETFLKLPRSWDLTEVEKRPKRPTKRPTWRWSAWTRVNMNFILLLWKLTQDP